MNKNRRKEISRIIAKIEEVVNDATSKLEDIKSDIENVLEEEQEYMDSIPENLQGSERYEMAEQAADNLESAVSSIEELIDALDTEELDGYLNDSME